MAQRQVRYNGVIRNFPADASDEEIMEALEAADRSDAAGGKRPAGATGDFGVPYSPAEKAVIAVARQARGTARGVTGGLKSILLSPPAQILAGLGRGGVNTVVGLARLPGVLNEASKAPAKTEAEIAAASGGGQLGLALHRTFLQPAGEEWRKAQDPNQSYLSRLEHGIGAVPVVGPLLVGPAKKLAGAESVQDFLNRGAEVAGEFGTGALIGKVPVKRGVQAATAAAARVPGQVAQKAKTVITGVPASPAKTMVIAVKPSHGKVGFETKVERALDELGHDLDQGRALPQTWDEFFDSIKFAQERVWNQFASAFNLQRWRGVRANAVADAMDRSIALKTHVFDPDEALRLQTRADVYRSRLFGLQELEEFLETTNAQLDAYYAKNPAARHIAESKNPDIAHLVTEGDALRNVIYGALDQAGETAMRQMQQAVRAGLLPKNTKIPFSAPRELKQRYGALADLKYEAYRRKNVAERQQPKSLAEQIADARAAGAIAAGTAGVVGGILTGQPTALSAAFGGGASILGGIAQNRMAHWLRTQQQPLVLIRSALERHKGRPTPVTMPPPPPAPTPVPPPQSMIHIPSVVVSGTTQRPSGGVFRMGAPPPAPPGRLGTGQKLLPANVPPGQRGLSFTGEGISPTPTPPPPPKGQIPLSFERPRQPLTERELFLERIFRRNPQLEPTGQQPPPLSGIEYDYIPGKGLLPRRLPWERPGRPE